MTETLAEPTENENTITQEEINEVNKFAVNTDGTDCQNVQGLLKNTNNLCYIESVLTMIYSFDSGVDYVVFPSEPRLQNEINSIKRKTKYFFEQCKNKYIYVYNLGWNQVFLEKLFLKHIVTNSDGSEGERYNYSGTYYDDYLLQFMLPNIPLKKLHTSYNSDLKIDETQQPQNVYGSYMFYSRNCIKINDNIIELINNEITIPNDDKIYTDLLNPIATNFTYKDIFITGCKDFIKNNLNLNLILKFNNSWYELQSFIENSPNVHFWCNFKKNDIWYNGDSLQDCIHLLTNNNNTYSYQYNYISTMRFTIINDYTPKSTTNIFVFDPKNTDSVFEYPANAILACDNSELDNLYNISFNATNNLWKTNNPIMRSALNSIIFACLSVQPTLYNSFDANIPLQKYLIQSFNLYTKLQQVLQNQRSRNCSTMINNFLFNSIYKFYSSNANIQKFNEFFNQNKVMLDENRNFIVENAPIDLFINLFIYLFGNNLNIEKKDNNIGERELNGIFGQVKDISIIVKELNRENYYVVYRKKDPIKKTNKYTFFQNYTSKFAANNNTKLKNMVINSDNTSLVLENYNYLITPKVNS